MNRGYRLSNRSKKFRYTWAVGLEGVSRLRGLRLWLVLAAAAVLAVLGTLSAPPPAGAQEIVLLSNTGETAAAGISGVSSSTHATRFTTGAHANGYSIASVTVDVSRGSNASMPQLSIYSSSEAGTTAMPTPQPNAELFSFDPPATFGLGLQTFTAPATGATLAPNTSYWIVVSGGSTEWQIRSNADAASHADSGSQSGWSFHGRVIKRASAAAWPVVNTGTTDEYEHLRISIQGEAHTSDQIPPTVTSVTVNSVGTEIAVTLNEPILTTGSDRGPNIRGAFTITADGRQRFIHGSSIRATGHLFLFLITANRIRMDQSVVVTYTDPTEGDDALFLEDVAGNDLATFTTGSGDVPAVVNNSTYVDTTVLVPDSTSFGFVVRDGDVLTIAFTDVVAVPDDAVEKAAFLADLAASFAITANHAPVAFTIDPSSDFLRAGLSFALGRLIGMGQIVEVRYTKPDTGTVFIEDESGNQAESFTRDTDNDSAVFFNDSTVDTPPWLGSATVNAAGTQLDLVEDQVLAVPTNYTTLAGRFTVTVDGASVTPTLPDASQVPESGRLALSFSTAIEAGQLVVVTYTDPTTGDDENVVEDAAGNEAATFTTGEDGVVAVTNKVGTEEPEGGPSIGGSIAVGETLTADTSTITDDDGASSPTYTYQWARVDTAGTATDISTATGSTYEIVSADAGNRLRLTVSFTDDASNPETRTVTTSYVPHQDRVLVSTFELSNRLLGTNYFSGFAQGFTVGIAGKQYRVSSKQWSIRDVSGSNAGDSQAGLFHISEEGVLGSQIATFPGTLTAGEPRFHAPTHALLDGGERYGITLWGGSQLYRIRFYNLEDTRPDSSSLSGSTIIKRYRGLTLPTATAGTVYTGSINFRVHGYEVADAAHITSLEITSDPGSDGVYATGETIAVTATLSEAATFSGPAPVLPIVIGDNTREAGYHAAASTPTSWVFQYAVTNDDTDNDGISIEPAPPARRRRRRPGT